MERFERALDRTMTRLLHGPLAALKEAARAGDGAAASQWVARLFRLHAQEEEEALRDNREQPAPKSVDAQRSGESAKVKAGE